MRKNLLVMAALVLGMAVSVTLTSCGDDEEPTPQQQEQGNGNDNGNNGNNGENGNDEGGDNGQGGDNGGQSGEDKAPVGVVAVDLGLPSGTLWATCNVGATKPEEYGLYFTWGETTGYTSDSSNGRSFDWVSYAYSVSDFNTLTKYCYNSSYGNNGFTDNLRELTTEDDAAYVNWGSAWRTPTIGQFKELINSSYTTTEWTTLNGVYGRKITSKTNGNSIFLPAAGGYDGSSFDDAGSWGFYWSRTLSASTPEGAGALYFHDNSIRTFDDDNDRCLSQSVRPVRNQ